MAKLTMMPMDLGKLCEALGVERPNEVVRVVLDIRPGHIPMLLVERMADAEKIVATLTGPGIEVRHEGAPGASKARHPDVPKVDGGRRDVSDAPTVHGSVRGANIAWGNGSVVQNSNNRR
jgi:hypothetical protein